MIHGHTTLAAHPSAIPNGITWSSVRAIPRSALDSLAVRIDLVADPVAILIEDLE